MPSEVEEIEAILKEKLRLVVRNRNGVDCAAGIDGIPQAAVVIAALRAKDREDGAQSRAAGIEVREIGTGGAGEGHG